MNNCLVTKLQAIVNDENLKKLGEMRIFSGTVENPDYTGTGNRLVRFTFNEIGSIRALGDGEFKDGADWVKTISYSANAQFSAICKNVEFQISVPKKATLQSLIVKPSFYINTEELLGCSSLTYLDLEFSSKSYGDISNLPETLTLAILRGTKIVGSIESLVNHRSLTTLSIIDTDIEGDLDTFAAGQYNGGSGRTSGTLSVQAVRAKLTRGGMVVSGNYTITFTSGGYTIS